MPELDEAGVLAPCPFCSGAAQPHLYSMGRWFCRCTQCDAHGQPFWQGGPNATLEEQKAAQKRAIAAWNRRALVPAEPAPSPARAPAGRCSKCGGRMFTRMDAAQPDGTFGPGDYVRCVECKEVYLAALSPAQPAEAVPVAWEGYWPGAGSVDSTTRLTRWESVSFTWKREGAQITPLYATPQPSPASAVEAAARKVIDAYEGWQSYEPEGPIWTALTALRAALGERK